MLLVQDSLLGKQTVSAEADTGSIFDGKQRNKDERSELKTGIEYLSEKWNSHSPRVHAAVGASSLARCRISRVLQSPQGYALLIGVGGSGKQSLSRLAAYMCSLEVFQITLTEGFGIQELQVSKGDRPSFSRSAWQIGNAPTSALSLGCGQGLPRHGEDLVTFGCCSFMVKLVIINFYKYL